MRLRPFAAGCSLTVAALFALPCAAGLSVEAMQQRQRALEAPGQPMQPGTAAPRAAAAALVGHRPATSPPLVDAALPGGANLQMTYTLLAPQDTESGIELTLGAIAGTDAGGVQPAGTRLAVPLGPGHAYLSYETRHWGPAWFGSLILDGAAPPLAAAGWRFGDEASSRWSADVFAGNLRGHVEPDRPWLIGMRLQWRPTESLALGFSRNLQWGGRGRNENLRSLANALLGRDNKGVNGITAENEPGNQLAAFDLRYDFAFAERVALGAYLQLGAEDKASIVPSRRMTLFGADAATTIGATSLRAIVEYADTTAGKTTGLSYRHPLYPAGYTHRGRLLGHPVGGDVRLLSVGSLLERGALFAVLALHAGRAHDGAQRYPAGDDVRGADIALTWAARERLTLGVSAQRWRAAASGIDSRAQAWARYSWP